MGRRDKKKRETRRGRGASYKQVTWKLKGFVGGRLTLQEEGRLLLAEPRDFSRASWRCGWGALKCEIIRVGESR